jgi:hypothetical protein
MSFRDTPALYEDDLRIQGGLEMALNLRSLRDSVLGFSDEVFYCFAQATRVAESHCLASLLQENILFKV